MFTRKLESTHGLQVCQHH